MCTFSALPFSKPTSLHLCYSFYFAYTEKTNQTKKWTNEYQILLLIQTRLTAVKVPSEVLLLLWAGETAQPSHLVYQCHWDLIGCCWFFPISCFSAGHHLWHVLELLCMLRIRERKPPRLPGSPNEVRCRWSTRRLQRALEHLLVLRLCFQKCLTNQGGSGLDIL